MVRVVGPASARFDGFLRRLGRDQAVAAVADQILAAGLDKGEKGTSKFIT
jgi:hypothetical protein